MATLGVPTHRRRPGIYRAAGALQAVGAVVFVLLLVFAGTAAYSAAQVASSSSQAKSLSIAFGPNGTVELTGSFELENPGFYPIQGFSLSARVANGAGAFLGNIHVGPTTIGSGASGTFPISVFLPITGNGPAASLLTVDQYLGVRAWGNATYAFLFPVSVSLLENRSWGAPFEGFRAINGTPTLVGSQLEVPVTVTFNNHASIADSGVLSVAIESTSFVTCGSGTIVLSAGPGTFFETTTEVALSAGCSPSMGHILANYTAGSGTMTLPSEPIP